VEVTVTKRFAIVATGGLIIVVSAVWFWTHRPVSAREVAERFRDCTIRADAECVQAQLSDTDLNDNKITTVALREFLEKNVKPYFPNPSSTAFDSTGEPENFLIFSGEITTNRGKSEFSVTVGPTDKGYKVVDGYAQLVLLAAILPKTTGLPQGSKRLRLLSAQIQALEPELTRSGFSGIRPKPGGPLQSWDQFATEMLDRAVRAEEIEAKLR
jgi:hypothetical protein